MVETVKYVIDWVILAAIALVVVFKFLLLRLTKFWPFFVLAIAFSYMGALRIILIASPHTVVSLWVGLFWPVCALGVIGLYLSLHRNMTAPMRHFGRRKDDLVAHRLGRRKNDLKPPATK